MTKPCTVSRMFAVLLPLALAACASPPADCSRHVDGARAAGAEDRWLASAIAAAEPHCRTQAIEAWLAAAGALDCSTRFAFAAARLGGEVDADCADPAYANAARLGRMIGELERERKAIDAELAEESLTETARRDLRQRSVTIDRDLPQLEALARFDDLLPPAQVPDAPN